MKRIAAFLLGLSLTIGIGAYAVTGGGLPSQPTFQIVTSKSSPGALGNFRAQGTGSGAANVSYVGFLDSTGTRKGFVGDGGGADSNISVGCDTNPCNITLSPTGAGVAQVGSNTILTNAAASVPDSSLSANVALKNATNTFTFNQVVTGTSPTWISNATSGAALVTLQNNGTPKSYFCLSTSAGNCTVGDAANDVAIRGDGTVYFSSATGGNAFGSLTQAGVFNVKTGGDVVIGAVSVCRQDGTNCPGIQTTITTTPTLVTGCTTTPTINFRFVKINSVVVMSSDGISCTSNSVSFFIPAALPSAAYEPAHNQSCLVRMIDNSNNIVAVMNINAGSLEIDPQIAAGAGAWTASGTKGYGGISCTYNLL